MTSTSSRRHHKERRKQGLTLATLNVRGALLPKFKEVLLLLDEFNVDFLAVQEAGVSVNSLSGLRKRAKDAGFEVFKGYSRMSRIACIAGTARRGTLTSTKRAGR